jgi:hypothetical protein
VQETAGKTLRDQVPECLQLRNQNSVFFITFSCDTRFSWWREQFFYANCLYGLSFMFHLREFNKMNA